MKLNTKIDWTNVAAGVGFFIFGVGFFIFGFITALVIL